MSLLTENFVHNYLTLFSQGIIYFPILEYFSFPFIPSLSYSFLIDRHKAYVKKSCHMLPNSFALRLEWMIFFLSDISGKRAGRAVCSLVHTSYWSSFFHFPLYVDSFIPLTLLIDRLYISYSLSLTWKFLSFMSLLKS